MVFPQIIGTLTATDKDDQPVAFTFSLASENSNFSIRNYGSKSFCVLNIYLLFLELVAMQQLEFYVKPNVLFLKCKIILTSKNILQFFKPDGRFWEPVWDHKYYLKCTTKTGNNESYQFDGLEDNSLCVVTLSQLMMFNEHSNTKWCCWEVYNTFKDGKKRNYIKWTITNYGNCRKRSWAQVQWLARVFFVWSLHDLLVPTWVLTRYGKTHSY